MLKQTVQFEDFDGVNRTKNLYFNLTLDDVMENADIEEEMEQIQKDFFSDGEVRELNLQEKSRIVNVIKRLMQMSYGVQKTVDGDQIFDKRPEVWEHFTQTAAYDAFLFSLFADESGEILVNFMRGVFPAHIRQQLAEQRGDVELPFTSESTEGPAPVAPDADPAWVQEKRYPTDVELRQMDKSELMMAMKAKTEGWYDNVEGSSE